MWCMAEDTDLLFGLSVDCCGTAGSEVVLGAHDRTLRENVAAEEYEH